MPSMSYCRFQNLLIELRDVAPHFGDEDLSVEEEKAREEVLKICAEIASLLTTSELKGEAERLRAGNAAMLAALKEIYECGSISKAERIAQSIVAKIESE